MKDPGAKLAELRMNRDAFGKLIEARLERERKEAEALPAATKETTLKTPKPSA